MIIVIVQIIIVTVNYLSAGVRRAFGVAGAGGAWPRPLEHSCMCISSSIMIMIIITSSIVYVL